MDNLPRKIVSMGAVFVLIISQVNGYCSKCVKIEEARAKEQALHPQKEGYYDDIIGLNAKPSDSSTHVDFKKDFIPKNSKELDRSDFRELNDYDGAIKSKFDKGNASLNISKTYSTLYTIFHTKNFLDALSQSFTLFVPSDEAFARLDPRSLVELTKPNNSERVAALVSNHVVKKKLLNKDFNDRNNLEVKALSGRNLTLTSREGKLYIDNVLILRAEPAGNDGIIYIIDEILGPF